MRYFILVCLFLLSLNATSAEVVATGEGKSFDEALTNAKLVAVERVNGAWIHGDSFVRDNLFSEKITQYNGGVIRKYEVLQSSSTTVTIKADVVPRSNEMTSNSVNVTADMKQELKSRVSNQAALEKAKQVVDSRERAIAFQPTKVMYINKGDNTTVVMNGEVSFQKKWLEDFKALLDMSGNGFNLNSFYKPVFVNVSGMDGHTEVTKSNFRFYDELGLYSFAPNGVRIDKDAKEFVQLTFTVKTADLLKVDKFVVKFL